MSILKRIISYFVLIFALLLIFGLVKNIWRLIHLDERIKQQEENLNQAREENKKFKEKLEYYQSDEFVEEQIRNKLQMAKPGETILILPEEINGQVDKVDKVEKVSSSAKASADKEEMANWQKWLKLFW